MASTEKPCTPVGSNTMGRKGNDNEKNSHGFNGRRHYDGDGDNKRLRSRKSRCLSCLRKGTDRGSDLHRLFLPVMQCHEVLSGPAAEGACKHRLTLCVICNGEPYCFATNWNPERTCKYFSLYTGGKCACETNGIFRTALAIVQTKDKK